MVKQYKVSEKIAIQILETLSIDYDINRDVEKVSEIIEPLLEFDSRVLPYLEDVYKDFKWSWMDYDPDVDEG